MDPIPCEQRLVYLLFTRFNATFALLLFPTFFFTSLAVLLFPSLSILLFPTLLFTPFAICSCRKNQRMEDEVQTIVRNAASRKTLLDVNAFLMRIEERTRLPNGYKKSWQTLQDAGQDSTPRIFYDTGGFVAWIAYIATKNAAEDQSRFKGKSELGTSMDELETKSPDYRKAVAGAIMNGADPEVAERIQHLCERLISKSPKRESSERHKKRRNRSEDSASSETAPIPRPAPTYRAGAHRAINHRIQHSIAEEGQLLVNASLAETTKFFPLYLSSAIGRIPDSYGNNTFAAAVSMTFPADRVTTKVECQMSIEISANKVEHLAMQLFQAHVETTAGLRYLFLPDGSKALPCPKLTLRGCRQDNISSIFGSETSNAIMASPEYQNEVKQGLNYTESVSMLISQGAEEVGVVLLSLGLREGTLIAQKLKFP